MPQVGTRNHLLPRRGGGAASRRALCPGAAPCICRGAASWPRRCRGEELSSNRARADPPALPARPCVRLTELPGGSEVDCVQSSGS